jgi:hypothetical protein
MFCVVFWDAIESRLAAASGGKHRMWLYVDDITIHYPVPELRQLVAIVESAVNDDLQGELNRKKSAMHLPCRAGVQWCDWPDEFKEHLSAPTLAHTQTEYAPSPPDTRIAAVSERGAGESGTPTPSGGLCASETAFAPQAAAASASARPASLPAPTRHLVERSPLHGPAEIDAHLTARPARGARDIRLACELLGALGRADVQTARGAATPTITTRAPPTSPVHHGFSRAPSLILLGPGIVVDYDAS